jgi:hypothetical protein
MRGYRPSEDYEYALARYLAFRDEQAIGDFAVMTMSDTGDFHPSVAHLVQRPTIQFRGNSRAGALKSDLASPPPVPRHEEPVLCRFTPFYDWNVLLPNGDVVLCCHDYELTRVLGNLGTDDYEALFTSPALNELRLLNQAPGHADASICKRCNMAVPESELHRPVPPARQLVAQAMRRRVRGLLPGRSGHAR